MFNSTILDVAIGMIFIYLLLSLMCTAANEIIELMLKKRAIDLERGIRELLAPGSNSGADDVVRKLYNHPLVNSLFGGRYENTRIASAWRYVMRTGLPSYIPARNFALALMDIILPGKTLDGADDGRSGAAGATAPPPALVNPRVVVNLAADVQPVMVPPPPPTPTYSLSALRERILAINSDQITQALIPLLDAAGNDVARVRENIEGWYNSSMDRVSSWYKRRAQVTILILGLFVAITVNVDTITVVKQLSTDKALRDSLVAASDAYAKANATASPSPSGPPSAIAANVSSAPALTAVCVADADSAECQRARDVQRACEDPNSSDCQRAKNVQDACKDQDSPRCKYLVNLQQIQALGLPIGWDSTRDLRRTWPGWHWKRDGGWWDQIYWHGLGWVLTALALSLGAPFWFDLLNKFIVIRSAVKPHEKSPEEGSKD